MGLEPALKNMNVLCVPELLRQVVPKARAIELEANLALSFCPDFGNLEETLVRGAQGSRGLIR